MTQYGQSFKKLYYPQSGRIVLPAPQARDLFGRMYTAEPFTIFDSKQTLDNAPIFWDEALVSGSGISSAYSKDEAATTITSTDLTAGSFVRQTFMRFNYQPGKEYGLFMTGVIDINSSTGTEAVIGLIDDNNGLAFVNKAGEMHVRIRSSVSGSPVDIDIPQSAWNVDPLDGTGEQSSIKVDFTQAQIFFIRFGWLGFNDPEFGVVVGSEIYICHKFANANQSTSVYMSTPNLPLRYSLTTTAESPAASLKAVCAEIHASGGQQPNGVLRHASTDGLHADLAVEDQLYAVIGIRLKTTHIGASIDMLRAAINVNTGTDAVQWLLVFNPQTITGTFTYADETNSAVQIARASGSAPTVTVGTGIIFDGGFANSGRNNVSQGETSDLLNAVRLGAAIDGTRDEAVLCVRPINGASNVDVEAALTWRELD